MTYLDHAATTPVRPEVREVLDRHLRDLVGNPSASHAAGRAARAVVEEAREQVAAALRVSPHDVVWTAGGTEADNLAVLGIARAAAFHTGDRHLVTTAVEHPAVLEPARWLAEREGLVLDVVDCEPDGTVAVARVLDLVREDTALVSVMAANNETGAVNDVVAIGADLADRGVAFHVDAVQALATLDVAALVGAATAVTLTAHKVGGPVGVGLLIRRRGLGVEPLVHGGGQERGMRSGTMAAALVGAGAAAVLASVAERVALHDRLRRLRERAVAGLAAVDGLTLTAPATVLASHVHATIADVDGEALTFLLDRDGVALAGGAACAAGSSRGSHVVAALEAADPTRVPGAPLRLSMGRTTTEADVDAGVAAIVGAVAQLRAAGGGGVPRAVAS